MVAVALSQNFAVEQAIAETPQHIERLVDGRIKLRHVGTAITRGGPWQHVGGTCLVPFNQFPRLMYAELLRCFSDHSLRKFAARLEYRCRDPLPYVEGTKHRTLTGGRMAKRAGRFL
jgi:hypothetical protein